MVRKAVLLSGGLGNQIFQTAVAHYLAQGSTMHLLSVGTERQHNPGAPDIAGFDLADDVEVHNLPPGVRQRLLRRLLGRVQVIGAERERSMKSFAVRSATRVAADMLLPEVGHFGGLLASRGYGYDPRVSLGSAPALTLGYFQSWLYSNPREMARILGGPRPARPCEWFDELASRAREERPIIVHVRLGDYRHLPGWALATAYYEAALTQLQRRTALHRVWLFSDEPNAALSILRPALKAFQTDVIEPPPQCAHPATVFSVMSLGTGYVIANSTFSYWAARLSGVEADRIFAPDPWFVEGPKLTSIVPRDWQRLEWRQ